MADGLWDGSDEDEEVDDVYMDAEEDPDDDDDLDEDDELDEDDDLDENDVQDIMNLLNTEELGQPAEGTAQQTPPAPVQQNQQNPPPQQTQPNPPAMRVTPNQLLQFLSRRGLQGVFLDQDGRAHGHDDDEADTFGRRRPVRRGGGDPFPEVPSEAGTALMSSGDFGGNELSHGDLKSKKTLAGRILKRELGLEQPRIQRNYSKLASQNLIPGSTADTVINNEDRLYSGQFSDDGNFFFTCSQGMKVRMYDTSNPFNWKYYKAVHYYRGQWTITDASLSPDNKFLAYSSIKNVIHLASTEPADDSLPTELNVEGHSSNPSGWRRGFGIWSVRFSGDGREIVVGTNNKQLCAYDIESRRTVLAVPGHADDVNAVCFGDKSSPHLLYSGSDDTTVKVWDRRSMYNNRPAGVFLGHTEGITYIDSKGDGRYVLSNSKDQTMRLWDLRKMIEPHVADDLDRTAYSTGFDYRYMVPDTSTYHKHPHDCSVVTFRGHKVLRTLIRCHFSPPGSTDSRYVYSGSYDGSVYIWNLDATLAGTINVNQAARQRRQRSERAGGAVFWHDDVGGPGQTCVRDASWHPNAPMIAATSWNGSGAYEGTCTTHTWNDGLPVDEGDPPMGHSVDALLRRSRRKPADPADVSSDDDDDDSDDEDYRPASPARTRAMHNVVRSTATTRGTRRSRAVD